MDPAKLKVVELRAELSHRGLDTKGNKAVLVERLRKALEEETGDAPEETTILKTDTEDAGGTSFKEAYERTPESPKSSARTPGRSARSASTVPVKTPTKSVPKGALTLTPTKQLSPVKTPVIEQLQDKKELSTVAEPAPEEPEIVEKFEVTSPVTETPELQKESVIKSLERERCTLSSEKTPVKEREESPIKERADESKDNTQILKESLLKSPDKTLIEAVESKESTDISVESPLKSLGKFSKDLNETSQESEVCCKKLQESRETISETLQEDIKLDPEVKADIQKEELFQENVEISEETSKLEKDLSIELKKEKEMNEVVPISSSRIEMEVMEEEIKDEEDEEEESVMIKEENTENVEKDDVFKQDEQDTEMKDIKQEEDTVARDKDRKDRKDRKRKRSPSLQEERHRTPPPIRSDDEPEFDEEAVLLSWYDSDLNLIIDKESFLSATPMHSDGFGYIWAGTRASYGFASGKVYYEIKTTEHCPITLQDETNPHVLRVGWSVANTSMQLGEDKLSYGYGGTGKKSTNNKFVDYGPIFSKDDIIGCYLDMTNDNNVHLSYTVNGQNLGAAFIIPKEELEGRALFPHILTKNCSFTCNFGQEEPWSQEILEGYSPVGKIELKSRVPGPRRPEKKEDCEMIMMCGLPASGKTVWASKYAVEHPEKMYNILGTNNLIEKMKVMGLPRKRNYHGRWEVLIDKCTRALNKLLEMACSRRRNFILDQTNVYPSAQRRKMRHFYGYQRRAVVVVPTDEEFKLRTAKREAIEGKDVPDSAVLEMKANFSAPTVGESFDVVDWVELGEEEAKRMIEKYNKEGKEAGFGQQQVNKRPRFERSDSHRESRDSRNSRDSRDSRDHRDRRSGYPDRNRNSGWRGSSSATGWRDRQQRGGHMRHSGYGGPGGWRGRTGPPLPSHRGSTDRRGSGGDRRPGNDRSRAVQPRQAGWGPMNSYHSSQQPTGSWGQQGGWTNNQSQQGGWGQQGSWGQQQWGNWKGFGQGTYSQAGYNQQNYGNGSNWGNWNQQYYNQYWGQQQQQQQTGQPTAAGGQATTTSGSTTTISTTTNSASTYGYSQGWQGYTQAYTFPAQTTSTQQVQQQK